jgi:two-component system CheB/CheR fusion protein
LIVLDADLRVILANRSFYSTFQVTPEDTEGKLVYNLGDRQWDIPRLREFLEDILLKNTSFDDFEVEHSFETIGYKAMLLNARRIYQKGNRTHMILLAIEDITERRQMQERLLVSERLATLGQFSGNIAHELRNPLSVIDSSVYYLKTKLKDADGKTQQHLDRIKSSVVNSTAIIESLLNLTRMDKPRLGRLNLIAITADAIAVSKVPSAVSIVNKFSEEEVAINADGEQLRMAFKNIIKNAVEAMDSKGMLTVTAHITADGKAEVSFTDTGPGIAVENLGRVFQPLFSTKAKGIGLGLSIAKTIINKHGGTIEAKSEPGKGANIIIEFPLFVDKDEEV